MRLKEKQVLGGKFRLVLHFSFADSKYGSRKVVRLVGGICSKVPLDSAFENKLTICNIFCLWALMGPELRSVHSRSCSYNPFIKNSAQRHIEQHQGREFIWLSFLPKVFLPNWYSRETPPSRSEPPSHLSGGILLFHYRSWSTTIMCSSHWLDRTPNQWTNSNKTVLGLISILHPVLLSPPQRLILLLIYSPRKWTSCLCIGSTPSAQLMRAFGAFLCQGLTTRLPTLFVILLCASQLRLNGIDEHWGWCVVRCFCK